MQEAGLHVPISLKALPFYTEDLLEAGERTEVTATPRIPFKPLRFIMEGFIGPNFAIEDIIIDDRSQFAGSGLMLWDNDRRWPMDTCPKDKPITLIVHNRSGVAMVFYALMLGEEQSE